jgi:acyl carrier protein
MTTDEILTRVQETLVDALGVDEDEVTSEATLVADLGAESIDFLDIIFRLEKNFDIKIIKGELFPENLTSADPDFVDDGTVTQQGIITLREKLPFADVDQFAEDPKVSRIQDLFTVQMLVNFLDVKLGAAV